MGRNVVKPGTRTRHWLYKDGSDRLAEYLYLHDRDDVCGVEAAEWKEEVRKS